MVDVEIGRLISWIAQLGFLGIAVRGAILLSSKMSGLQVTVDEGLELAGKNHDSLLDSHNAFKAEARQRFDRLESSFNNRLDRHNRELGELTSAVRAMQRGTA